jgi:MFS family permease
MFSYTFSVQCGGVVVFAQLLQGVGGGVISSQVLGTIQDMFDGSGRTKAMSAYGSPVA